MKSKEVEVKLVYSIDADGCVFNRGYGTFTADELPNRLIDKNGPILEFISSEIKSIDSQNSTLMSGSSRQSRYSNKTNLELNGTESWFSALMRLEAEITKRSGKRVLLDKILLADLYTERYNPGDCFEEAVEGYSFIGFGEWFWDETKITILYAQMHKMASENPNMKIIFNFFDDRDDILNGLLRFFSQNPLLIPYNLTLRLHHYSGEPITSRGEIEGVGSIDPNYRNSLKLIVKKAGYNPEDVNEYNAAKHENIIDFPVNDFINARKEAEIALVSIPQTAPKEVIDTIKDMVRTAYAGDEAFFSFMERQIRTHTLLRAHEGLVDALLEKYGDVTSTEAPYLKMLEDICQKYFAEKRISLYKTSRLEPDIIETCQTARQQDLDLTLKELANYVQRYMDKSLSAKHQSFGAALNKLHTNILSPFTQFVSDELEDSTPLQICRATKRMLEDLDNFQNSSKEQRIAIIQEYENKCRQTTGWGTFSRVIGTLIFVAIGIVLGAAIGYGIGISLPGADWMNPLEAFSNVIDMFNGSVTNEAVSLITGSIAGGIIGGIVGGMTFFAPDKITQSVNAVARAARSIIEEKPVSSAIEESTMGGMPITNF